MGLAMANTKSKSETIACRLAIVFRLVSILIRLPYVNETHRQ
jgi:hypothetical protein